MGIFHEFINRNLLNIVNSLLIFDADGIEQDRSLNWLWECPSVQASMASRNKSVYSQTRYLFYWTSLIAVGHVILISLPEFVSPAPLYFYIFTKQLKMELNSKNHTKLQVSFSQCYKVPPGEANQTKVGL